VTDVDRQLAQLGKGIVQVNLRLARLTELLERQGSTADRDLAPLLDLLDAIDRTLRARRAPWWRAWLQPPDLDGLALARDQAVQGLLRMGIRPAPADGPVDPRLHQVLEVLPSDPTRDGCIAATHRTGWVRDGDPPAVLRLAHVTACKSNTES
jgi:molecular chaperone GrpE (heat shock protein)